MASNPKPAKEPPKPAKEPPKPEPKADWDTLFVPNGLWYRRPTTGVETTTGQLPQLMRTLYPLLVVMMPFIFRYAMLSLQPADMSRINIRSRWGAPEEVPAVPPGGRPAAPQSWQPAIPPVPRLSLSAPAPSLSAPRFGSTQPAPADARRVPRTAAPAPTQSLAPWLGLAQQAAALTSGTAASIGPPLRAGASLVLPPALQRLLGADGSPTEGMMRARMKADADAQLVKSKVPQLASKAGESLVALLRTLWGWLQLLLRSSVEPLVRVLSESVRLTEPMQKKGVYEKWTSETTAVLDEFNLLLKSSGANIGAYLMASELAKAFLVPVLVGFWPALAMGQMTQSALDSAVNR